MVKRALGFCLLMALGAWAGVGGEVVALDSMASGSGTRLVSMPTYVYERASGSLGLHAADEEWSPARAGERHLPNRYSQILDWQIGTPGMWFSTGNEIGDLLYQELLEEGHGANRTPMLDGGFTSPSWKGWRVTAQGSQVDHWSSATLDERTRRNGSMSFAWFGENLPAYSTAHAGIAYAQEGLEAEAQAGRDYLWVLTRTRRWVPVEVSPRTQLSLHKGLASLDLSYEKQHYADEVNENSASKEEVAGTLRMACARRCAEHGYSLGGGLSFRHESDSGAVPWGVEGHTLAWPWLEASVALGPWARLSGHAGMNDKHWLVRDSLEIFGQRQAWRWRLGLGSRAGSTLDPLGYTYESYQGDTLDLQPDGYAQAHRFYLSGDYIRSAYEWGLQAWAWGEKGAETFRFSGVQEDNGVSLRSGSAGRIDEWLGAAGASMHSRWKYEDWFKLDLGLGGEQYAGAIEQAEIRPVQGWSSLQASWMFPSGLSIEHALAYHSSSSWQQEGYALMVPGGWSWNASLSQLFPAYHTTLKATWLHVLPSEAVQAPRGGYDRTRFFCSLRTDF